jgi:general secretion pathway protein C
MLDDRIQNLISKASSNGPWLASLGLAALIAVELARMALGAFGGAPLKSLAPAAPSRATTAPAHRAIDVQQVVSAHLFGIATAEPTAVDPADAPVSSANLVLAGTIATQDPKHGVAIISDGGPSKVYSVGDSIAGATVHSVYLDRVLLDRGGSLESLVLPRLLEGGAGPAAAPRQSGVFGGQPQPSTALDSLRRRVQQEPGMLNEIMRTVPSYDNKAGKLRGFRAYPGHNRTIFAKLGLKPGDLVTAINGTPLDDPQRSQEVLNTIQSSEHATVTVERAGQRQDITLNIANVAQQAVKDLDIDAGQPGGPAGSTGANPPPPPASNDDPND